ncbi:U5 small nuclear ribonucleoprotein TSSC4 [Menidia menidia]
MSDQKRLGPHGEVPASDDVDELSASDDSEPEERPSGAPFDPDLDCSDGDEEVEFCAPAVQSPFILSGGGSAFSLRSHSIFNCLDGVEKQPVTSLKRGIAKESQNTSDPPPACPTPPKKRGVPDYLLHPERWTRYSLEDVPESSDQDNRRAAHQFLSSLRQEAKPDPPCDIKQRMVFSKPKKPLKEQLPEQALADQPGKEKGLSLSHLSEGEEGQERGGGGGGEQARLKTEQLGQADAEEDEGVEVTGAVDSAERKKRVQEKTMQDSSPSFTSFRKIKGKNYRRSSVREDD